MGWRHFFAITAIFIFFLPTKRCTRFWYTMNNTTLYYMSLSAEAPTVKMANANFVKFHEVYSRFLLKLCIRSIHLIFHIINIFIQKTTKQNIFWMTYCSQRLVHRQFFRKKVARRVPSQPQGVAYQFSEDILFKKFEK